MILHIAADLDLPSAISSIMKQETSDIIDLRDRAGSSPIHRYAVSVCVCVQEGCGCVREWVCVWVGGACVRMREK